ncbi:MAG: alcohol dehydrogenase catalytic domain-containing protein, partial [Candidatus Binataceae bacterium]
MKVAVFKRQNEMSVSEAPVPKAAAGEVVLKVHDCGICGSDLHAVQFDFGMPPDTIMGHEFCGEVHEIGEGVTGFSKGDRVAALPFVACGTCDRCQRGMEIHCHNLK